jgi:hypothetical protein
MTAKGRLTHNRFWRNGGPYLDYVPFGLRSAARPSQRRAWRKAVAKYHARPSTQYRYEHYDPIGRA